MDVNGQAVPHASRRAELIEKGCCIIPGVLDESMLAYLRRATDEHIRRLPQEHLQAQKSTGTMIHSKNMPELAPLIVWPPALKALHDLGFRDCRFWTGYVISKPGPSPRLFWHQDCIMWDDPRSYSDTPPMLFFMYYLTDTSRVNGCLRVIPGTHRGRHPLHDLGEVAHTEAVRRMDNPDSPVFADMPGEVDVPVRAGDLVVGDARLFHATHANTTTRWRTVITLWYHPQFATLSGGTRRWLAENARDAHARWPGEALASIQPVMPTYHGQDEKTFNRSPDARLA